ncbi:MAG TPA: hemolysin family protein [Vicinamibacterales bacterium]|nr:hemolysin family protein [Vicinamibacterales bacterium]
MDSLLPGAVVAALVLLNGYFVAAEFAIVGAPAAAIEALAARGHRAARAVARVLRDPRRQDRFIATAQLGITVASLGLGMYGEEVLADGLAVRLERLGAARWIAAHALASAVAVAVLTYLHIVVGEMVPKSLALQYAERAALWIAPSMLWLERAAFPLVVALNGLGNAALRLVGIRRGQPAERFYTPEELQLIVEESEARGALRGEAGRLLRELFEFGDLTAAGAMVPRVRVTGVPLGADAETVRRLLRASPHTRYPVYEGDLDHIVGMIHIKDLLEILLAGDRVDASRVRPLPVVPETTPLDDVLVVMQREGTQMALVIDEHGGTAGIITLEDLFEEVVGEIDESAAEPPDIVVEAPDRLRVRGTVRVAEVGERFDLDLRHADVDSVSGLVLTLLGRPPRAGDEVEFGRLVFTVTAVKGRGVEECVVRLRPAAD